MVEKFIRFKEKNPQKTDLFFELRFVVNGYQESIKNYGPHSHQGLFYRKVLSEKRIQSESDSFSIVVNEKKFLPLSYLEQLQICDRVLEVCRENESRVGISFEELVLKFNSVQTEDELPVLSSADIAIDIWQQGLESEFSDEEDIFYAQLSAEEKENIILLGLDLFSLQYLT